MMPGGQDFSLQRLTNLKVGWNMIQQFPSTCRRRTNVFVWALGAACFFLSVAAGEAVQKVSPEDCTLKALKAFKAEKVNLSKWGSAAGTPFGGMWTTRLENAPQGQDWLILSGKLDCRSGFPLEGTKLDNSSGVFPALAYSGSCVDTEKEKFNVIENSPGTGRTGADGKMLWVVMPSKETGARHIYLDSHLFEPGAPGVDLCLLFAVPKTAKELTLRIGERPGIPVAVEK